jgi:AraC-like DNA-binding protein
MSEKTLNSGFRSLYGATAFAIMRDERLEHARIVLESEGLSMKTVAHRVSYNHESNFTRAFTERFGARPRRYLEAKSAGT